MAAMVWGTTATGRLIRLAVLAAITVPLLLVFTRSPSSEAASPSEPFTFVVLPDTQSYTLSETDEFIVGQQTRWIRDYRADLNTAFVAQVGDLVESHPSDPMWQRASVHMKVLDDAGIPNAVLPGNHDMNVATGEAAKFDEYFPPSRYQRSAWTPSTSQYGGYLGQDLYGPDPVDRGNKDSFSIFSAGGMNFLVLSLEYEAPDYAIEWAQKVIDNHPDRRVIVSTHGFIDTDDRRGSFTTRTDPGINSAPKIWDKLIFPNCNIFMVVNGHWTSRSDKTDGEGQRTDANACGTPVHQLLSNYQGRPEGGEGWLRYYTFDPAEDTISARTYSPYLGEYETDDDSEFTLPYPMSTPKDDLATIHAPAGADWRYRFDASAPDASWTSEQFDDSGWTEGPAPLGFGEWEPATDLGTTPSTSRPLAAQFRQSVDIADAGALVEPRLTVFADDGVVVYVNGTEVGRSNLPDGSVPWDTYAVKALSHDDAFAEPITFPIPDGLLTDGTNTIAAQVSSNYKASKDMTFEATLTSSASSP